MRKIDTLGRDLKLLNSSNWSKGDQIKNYKFNRLSGAKNFSVDTHLILLLLKGLLTEVLVYICLCDVGTKLEIDK